MILLFDTLSRRRFDALASAVPMLVPVSGRMPFCIRSRFCSSHVWSSVAGLIKYGRPAKTMMPSRSFGRASMKRLVTSFTASRRLAGCPPSVKSSATIEPETSSASMMSTPLDSMVSCVFPSRGRASAMMSSASAMCNSTRANPPHPAFRFCAPKRIASTDEKRTAGIGPRPPCNHASTGSAASRSSHHGCAKLKSSKFMFVRLARMRLRPGAALSFRRSRLRRVRISASRSAPEMQRADGDRRR